MKQKQITNEEVIEITEEHPLNCSCKECVIQNLADNGGRGDN